MQRSSSYKPIACSTYDQYEIWAMHKTLLHIQLKDREIEAKIKTLTVQDKVEYAVLDTEEMIRLDEILKTTEVGRE